MRERDTGENQGPVLESYLDKANFWGSIFGSEVLERGLDLEQTIASCKTRHETTLRSIKRHRILEPDFLERQFESADLTAFGAYFSGLVGVRKPSRIQPKESKENGFLLLERAEELNPDDLFYKWVLWEENERQAMTPTERAKRLKPSDVWDSKLARSLSRKIRRVPDAFKKMFEDSRFLGVGGQGGLFERMIINHQIRQRELYKFREEQRKKSHQFVFGEEFKGKPRLTLSTSTYCIRRAQYEELGYDVPNPTFKRAMALLEGSALHKVYQQAAWELDPDYVATEMYIPPTLLLEETDVLRGKPDLVIRIKGSKDDWQVIDYKNIHPFRFVQLKRQDVPEYLRRVTKDFYYPFAEDRLQVLLYMYILRTKFNKNVVLGKVPYIAKGTYEKKEALILWDEAAEQEVEEFKRMIMEATNQVEAAQRQLADGTITLDELKTSEILLFKRTAKKPWVCKGCDFLIKCPLGQAFAATEINEGEPLDENVLKAIRIRLEQERIKTIKLGVQQTTLPAEDLVGIEKGK